MIGERIWVVDDEQSIREYLRVLLDSRGYSVECFSSGELMLAALKAEKEPPSAILLDVLMPVADGIDVLTDLQDICPGIPTIMLSCTGQTKTVVAAMRRGAADYLCKPFDDEQLELALESVFEKFRLRDEVKTLRKHLELRGTMELSSTHPGMLRVIEVASLVADADVPVLIAGESGVGKEVVARMIHARSSRESRPFVKVNCAALPHDLLESELFGYDKGAFTGAMTDKPGKFEQAEDGFILLDEIGDMSPLLQAKLLHILQDGEYSRLGAKKTKKVRARVLAASNKDLEEEVAEGRFREDLYFRLNVIRIEIPPLRERREDITVLADHLFRKYREKYRSDVDHLPAALVDAFQRHDWPGNVRQLENAVKRFLILSDLDLALAELKPSNGADIDDSIVSDSDGVLSLKEIGARAAENAERETMLKVLDETNWNRKMAAGKLNISYKAFRNKLKKWQIDGPRRMTQPNGNSVPSGERNLSARA